MSPQDTWITAVGIVGTGLGSLATVLAAKYRNKRALENEIMEAINGLRSGVNDVARELRCQQQTKHELVEQLRELRRAHEDNNKRLFELVEKLLLD